MGCSPDQTRLNAQKSTGPRSARGKAIVARNATKHGLLAEKPPLLAGEDLATFQGILQALVDEHQPSGPLEWHCVQQIAMCIQRQHRLWAAEAAAGNEAILPPVQPPIEQYPAYEPEQPRLTKTASHPDNLQIERALLQKLIDKYPPADFPTKYRAKYFDIDWVEWQRSVDNLLNEILRRYPCQAIPGFPVNNFIGEKAYTRLLIDWLKDLQAAGHPYGVINNYVTVGTAAPRNQPAKAWEVTHYKSQYQTVYDACWQRLDDIATIEATRQQEAERVKRQQAERDRLTASPLSPQAGLLCRYESHINNQLMQALERLNTLQGQRKADS